MDNQSSNKTLTSKYNIGDESQNQNFTNKQQSNTANKKQASKSDYDTITAKADANNYI